jgi:hypothetical protein
VTAILAVVAPVDQRYVVPALEVNVTLPPVQKVNGPLAVIVGIGGIGLTVTDVAADGAEVHPDAFVI